MTDREYPTHPAVNFLPNNATLIYVGGIFISLVMEYKVAVCCFLSSRMLRNISTSRSVTLNFIFLPLLSGMICLCDVKKVLLAFT